MPSGLGVGPKALSEIATAGAGRDCGRGAAAGGDTARRQHRQVANRVPYFWNQRERGHAATHMAAGLESLRDYRIGAGAFGRERFVSGAALPDDLQPEQFAGGNVLGRIAPEKRHRGYRLARERLEDTGAKKRDQEIHDDWLLRNLSRRGNLIVDSLRREPNQSNRAEAARFRHGSSENRERNSAHPGAHDWIFDSEQLAEARRKHKPYPRLAALVALIEKIVRIGSPSICQRPSPPRFMNGKCG